VSQRGGSPWGLLAVNATIIMCLVLVNWRLFIRVFVLVGGGCPPKPPRRPCGFIRDWLQYYMHRSRLQFLSPSVCAHISADFRSRRIWADITFRKLRPRAGRAPLAAATRVPTMGHHSARFTMRGGRGVGIPLRCHFHLEARGDIGEESAKNLQTDA